MSRGEVTLDLSHLKPGDTCGFGTLGKFNGHIAVECGPDGKLYLNMNVIEDKGEEGQITDVRVASLPISGKTLSLRTDLDLTVGKAVCSYSLDGAAWKELGGEFDVRYDWRTGTFQGPQFAIFCYNPSPGDGFLDVDSFVFTDKKP